MRIHRIVFTTYAEGPGCRFSIWVQGCRHKCDGCFATDLWDFSGGYEADTDKVIRQINEVRDLISGITFLGGEPFEYADELAETARYVHSIGKNVITFTGYTYNQLLTCPDFKPLLDETDLLIDGRFEKSLTDYSRPLVGSSNQKFIFLTDRISENEIKNYKNRFEVRISESGKAEFNGMGNIEKLKRYIQSFKEK